MQIELLMVENSEACNKALALWRSVCASKGLELAVVMADSAEGRRILVRLGLGVLPVLLIDGSPVAVGVPTREQALSLVSSDDHVLR